MEHTADLLLEIGVEELPASYVDRALAALLDLFKKRLTHERLQHAKVRTLGTPRRLAVMVDKLALYQSNLTEQVMGPPVRIAFDSDGKPTKAAQAFASKVGCTWEQLTKVRTPKGEYLSATRYEEGKSAQQILALVVPEIYAAIPFRKSMRWADGETVFGRPVRWLVALLAGEVIDFAFAGLRTGRTTYGHRFLAPDAVELDNSADYIDILRARHVIVDPIERDERMMNGLKTACQQAGVVLVDDAFLRMENVNLVEEPHVIMGRFDEAFLALPEEVIIAVAKGHQRYFCARRTDGKLAPMYLAVAGTAERSDMIRQGNDRVMRARLADAQFFLHEDMKVALEGRFEQLAGIVFQSRLGSVQDKVKRVEGLTEKLAKRALGEQVVDGDTMEAARRGAHLSKCDLASLMVGEFPELQGQMGAVYAAGQGESELVADVIREHYRPKGAHDTTALKAAAALVAIADRVDTLVGCFAVGLMPTGAADPYALRRACLGVMRTILDHGFGFEVSWMVRQGYGGYDGVKMDLTEAQLVEKLGEFFQDRLRGLLIERHRHDVVDACLAAGADRIADVRDRVIALEGLDSELRTLAGQVFKRATNIAKDAPAGEAMDPLQLGLAAHKTEITVFGALKQLEQKLKNAHIQRDYPAAFGAIADFAPLLESFFTDVYVMDDDIAVRENRLRLMRSISEHCSGIAHFNLLT